MIESVLQYAGARVGARASAAAAPLAPAEIDRGRSTSASRQRGDGAARPCSATSPPICRTCSATPAALRSAVQNLLANAVKYGGADRWVGVRAEQVSRGRQPEVCITVERSRRRHSAGRSAAHLRAVLPRRRRGGRQIHGNGLGLSLVQRIVQRARRPRGRAQQAERAARPSRSRSRWRRRSRARARSPSGASVAAHTAHA